MIKLAFIFLLGIRIAVSADSTPFQDKSVKKDFGYEYLPFPGSKHIMQAIYESPKDLDPDIAKIYSVMAADIYCYDKGEVSILLDPYEYTKKNDQRGFGQPFFCLKKVLSIPDLKSIKTVDLPAYLLRPFVKDSLGAVLVTGSGGQFKAQDIILEIAGQRLSEMDNWSSVLSHANSLDPEVKVLRDGKTVSITAKLKDDTVKGKALTLDLMKGNCKKVPPKAVPEFCTKL